MTWKQTEIRAARQTPLKPVLEQLGYQLEQRPNDNFNLVGTTKEIVIKKNYWVCLDDDTSGNAIDFLIKIRGMPSGKAMELLLS